MHLKNAWWGLDGAPDTHGSVYHEPGPTDDHLDAFPLLMDTSSPATRHKAVEAAKEESANIAVSYTAAAHMHYDECEVSSDLNADNDAAASASEGSSSDVDMDSSEDDEDGQVADSKIAAREALKRAQEEEERRIAAMYPKRPRLWDPDKAAREKEEAQRQHRMQQQDTERLQQQVSDYLQQQAGDRLQQQEAGRSCEQEGDSEQEQRYERLQQQEEAQERERQEVLTRSYACRKRRRVCGAESSEESLGSTEHHLRTGRSIWRRW